MRYHAPGEEDVLERCVALLEDRLLRKYRRALGDLLERPVRVVPGARLDGLSLEEIELAERIDGESSLAAIAGSSFDVHRALHRLAERGLLEPVPAVVARATVEARPSGYGARRGLYRPVAFAAPPAAVEAPRPVEAPPPAPIAPTPAPPLPAAVPVVETQPPPPRPPQAPAPVARPRDGGRASLHALSVAGPVSRAEVQRALERRLDRLEVCYARAAARSRPRPYEVRAILVFDAAGKVTAAAVSNTAPHPLRACARDALRTMKGVDPDGKGARASLQLRFTPKRGR